MTYLLELGVDLGVENLSSKSCILSSLPNNCVWFFLGPCFPFLLFSIIFRGDSPMSYFDGWLTLAGVWPQAWLAIRMLKNEKLLQHFRYFKVCQGVLWFEFWISVTFLVGLLRSLKHAEEIPVWGLLDAIFQYYNPLVRVRLMEFRNFRTVELKQKKK